MVRKRAGGMGDVELHRLDIGRENLLVISVPADEATPIPDDLLSAAEVEVARDAAAGLSNAAIAKKRGTAVRTVANQLASIYRKLGVTSRAELAALLVELVR